MSITNVLALSSTNRLTPAERKALGKSDHKASKVLGITLTRNRVGRVHHDRSPSLCLSQDQENAQGDDTLEENIAIGAKRPRSRNASTATVIGPLKYLGRVFASGMGMVEKRNKNRIVAEEYTQRVVLGALPSNESPSKDGKEELPTGVGNDSAYSLPDVDESEDTKALLGTEYSGRNDEEGEDDLLSGLPRGLVWGVDNSLATPPSPTLEQHEEIWLHETTGALDVLPVASLWDTPNFEVSFEGEIPALSSRLFDSTGRS